jgi:hypothetical protein
MPGEPASTTTGSRAIAFPIALGVSLALHAGLGVALGVCGFGDGSPDADGALFEEFSTDPDRPEPRFVALGNPDSRVSSLTWIGYEEFEEMWAPPSEVDQAQQDPDEPGSPTVPEQPVLDPSDQPATTEPEPTTPAEEPLPEPDDALELVTPAIATSPETLGEVGPPDYSELFELVDAIEDLASDIPRFNPVEALRNLRTSRTADRTEAPEASEPSSPAEQTTEVVDQRDPNSPPVSGESGQNADRESDAAAVKPVKNADLGKPLAAEGLSIRTVRPDFSNVTLATARPRNPVVRIDFRRNGKPIRVVVIKSSGHEQVDIDVRKALYAWRASGEALLQLPDPEDPDTPAYVSVKLEILL